MIVYLIKAAKKISTLQPLNILRKMLNLLKINHEFFSVAESPYSVAEKKILFQKCRFCYRKGFSAAEATQNRREYKRRNMKPTHKQAKVLYLTEAALGK